MGLLFRHLLIPSNNLNKTTGKYKAGTLRDLERRVNSKTPNCEKIMPADNGTCTSGAEGILPVEMALLRLPWA